ncbi:unnamed protein product [Pieris macdunnoughi]|uniref:Caspase-3 n=1 Tax=Pieris macdunnoughi TaxID=345717 RepID=A0A821TCC8_9NEOP|nr:unnamed protein product [Pieris macdunnoughi]
MDETQADASASERQETNSSVPVEIRTKPSFNPNDLYYDMSGIKYLYIFNHYEFQKTKYFNNKRPTTRDGTHKDVSRLTEVFENLGFKVKVFNEKEHRQILDEITEITSKDHKEASCIFFAFLSHGDKDGIIYAADRPYQFKDVLAILENCHSSLLGKPKVLFVQACRGNQMDSGRRIELDSSGRASYLIPTHADFLVLYSTVEDHVSYRNVYGSFLIQDLCDIIEAYREFYDLLHMLTLVHNRVAFYRSTYTPSKLRNHNKKQMPETKYSLTKLIRL